ncbi:MAG: ABC transporter permease [Armatimonadota bacterium]
MVWFLARRNLRRSASRTALVVAGVTVAGALLFDMSMLGGGLEQSFAEILGGLGYEIRVVLRGTLPLSTEALMSGARDTARRIEGYHDVAYASPVLGTNLYVEGAGRRSTAFAYGLTPEVRRVVRLVAGHDAGGVVINPELAANVNAAPGGTVRLATRIDPQTGQPSRAEQVTVTGVGEFVFDLKAQRTLALPLERLQNLLGISREQASFLVVKLRPGADPERVARWIEGGFPDLDAFSIATLLRQVREQLTYLNHFAAILTSVSLLVAVLLIGAVLTLAVGERLGELATLRAIGLSRSRMMLLIVLEGAVLAGLSIPLALLLGTVVSRPLDHILRATPGIPQDLHFFIFSSRALGRTMLLLLAAGTLGAVYPAWVAGRLNVAATLHQEVQ